MCDTHVDIKRKLIRKGGILIGIKILAFLNWKFNYSVTGAKLETTPIYTNENTLK